MDGLAMASAEPEKNNLDYLTDKECPIIWYLMDTDISRQGKVIKDAIDELQESMDGKRIRMVWQPMNGKKSAVETFYRRDIMEIADTMIRIKEKAKRSDIDIRAGLATSWYPSGKTNHTQALSIARLNLAIELFSYYWLRVRCIDLSRLTMVPRKSRSGIQEEITEDETINIRGYEDEKFNPRHYRDARRYPLEIAFYPARRAREVIRQIFLVYGIEPDWEKARNARDSNWRIVTPAVHTGGRFEELPAPRSGEKTYLEVSARVSARLRFEKDQNYEGILPSLQLKEYPWEFLNTQSLDETLPLVPDVMKFSLSPHNQVLDDYIPRTQLRIERVQRGEGESSSESTSRKPALERLGPKVKAPEPQGKPKQSSQDEYDSWGDVVEEDEGNQSQELEDPCPIDPYERSPRRRETDPEIRTRTGGARGDESEPGTESRSQKKSVTRVEPEPSKKRRDDRSPSVEMLSRSESGSQSQDESSDDSDMSSSTDEDERKERRVRAMISFLDRYDKKETLRLRKKQKLKKQWEKARRLRQDKKKAQRK